MATIGEIQQLVTDILAAMATRFDGGTWGTPADYSLLVRQDAPPGAGSSQFKCEDVPMAADSWVCRLSGEIVSKELDDLVSYGSATPGAPFKGSLWYDTVAAILKQYDGTAWQSVGGGGGGASQLSDLTDVNTSTPTAGNVLRADGVDWESAVLAHSDLGGVGTDDHHPQSHTVASHSDTTATGAELETLTDGSDASSLHIHDGRYFTETEHINSSLGAADAGKPIKLDAGGLVSTSMIDNLAASKITTGQLALARGGLGFDASGIAAGGLLEGTGSGTMGILAVGSANEVLATNGAALIWTDLSPYRQVGLPLTVEDPQDGDTYKIAYAPQAMTLKRATFKTMSGSLTFNMQIRDVTTPETAGTSVWTANKTANGSSASTPVTSFDTASVAQYKILVVKIVSVSSSGTFYLDVVWEMDA